MAVTEHGGSLGAARALFPGAPEPWIDLSTGINPHAYPQLDLPQTALKRLPEPSRVAALCAVAAKAYGAPHARTVVAAPGTQILLPLVAGLVAPGRARILGPTYAEHAVAADLAGHDVEDVDAFDALFDADLAVVVNPNNPDGRMIARDDLVALAKHLAAKGGLLVVDEAFLDVAPDELGMASMVEEAGAVVLRSFGKFFGLAGVRLGFAVAPSKIAEHLAMRLGPWAVSGPALEYGLAALADRDWQAAMRRQIAAEAGQLDRLLTGAGLTIIGGTPLYRLIEHADAQSLFITLGQHGIAARRFAGRATLLRFGLPAGLPETRRLADALDAWVALHTTKPTISRIAIA